MNENAIIIVLALLLDILFGDPPNALHPVAAMGQVIHTIDSRLGDRSPTVLFWGGAIIVVTCIVFFALIPVMLVHMVAQQKLLSILVQVILLKMVFSLRRLLQAGKEVQNALENGDIRQARKSVAMNLVSRDTAKLGEGHVASAAIESLAENLSDSFIAPVMMYLIGGLPLAWVYRSINTADAMIGYRTGRYEYLGKIAARLDDLLNWLPARISAVMIIASCYLLSIFRNQSFRVSAAWQVMMGQHTCTSSPNAGFPMSAAAGALGVRLEKIGEYTLDGGYDLPTHQHIARSRLLIATSAALWSMISLLVTIIIR